MATRRSRTGRERKDSAAVTGPPRALAESAQDVNDPLAAAKQRGREAKARILAAEGGTLSAEQAAQRLDIRIRAVEERRRAGRLIALPLDRRTWVYPAWQFVDGGILPGLELVLDDMIVKDCWMQTAFFLSGDPRLHGATPLAELRRGRVEEVRHAARLYGEHGAA